MKNNIEQLVRLSTDIHVILNYNFLYRLTDLPHWIVTSNVTGWTYRNIYCAVCHGVSVKDIIFWNVDLHCPDPSDGVTAPPSLFDTTPQPMSPNELLNFYSRLVIWNNYK